MASFFGTQCGDFFDWLNVNCGTNSLFKSYTAAPGVPQNLLLPPSSGQDAQQTITGLLNKELEDQQAIDNASMGASYMGQVYDELPSLPSLNPFNGSGGSPFTVGSIPWTYIGIGVVGYFALAMLMSPKSRRYGR